jgi:hypothetical protein
MIEIVYVSRAHKRFNSDELADMLRIFRKNNQKVGITGLFLYDGYGTFIQALEGNPDSVKALYEKIRNDDRHSRVNLIGENVIQHRNFPDWRMGFKNLDLSPVSDLDGYSDFLQKTNRASYLSEHPSLALDLLEYFKLNTKSNLDKD